MSASKDKLQRKQQIEAGTDKRAAAAAKEAAERRKTNIRYTVVAAILVVVFAFVFIYNSALPAKMATGVTIDGEKYSVAQLNYYYSSSYISFYNSYYSYISYGLFFDPSLSLSTQQYSEDQTWRDYFLDQAISDMTQIHVLCKAAEEAGFTLSEEYQAQYEANIEALSTGWQTAGYSSLKQYLAINYGKGVTMQIVEQELYRTILASAYAEYLQDSYAYTAEELAAYHTEHADEMDTIEYAYYLFSEEGDLTAEEIAAAVNGTSEEEFTAYLEENLDGAAPTTTSSTGAGISELYSAWLLDSARTAGDAAAFTDEENALNYVVMFLDRDDGSYPLVSFRHILINAEDADGDGAYSEEELTAAADTADAIYQEWLTGEATEDSFAQLATLYSQDSGSSANGGLYENVHKGQMVEAINDWLFEEGRASGDTVVVTNEGSYTGAHVVYFVGTGDQTYAQYTADQTMRSEAFSEWLAAAQESVTVVPGSLKLAAHNR